MEEIKNEESKKKEDNKEENQKSMGKGKPSKKCFIITPIGDVDSETFRMAKGVIESVIKPLLFEHGYTDIKPSYEINETGMISTQIINRILDDDLVIANLTGNNPNVMYELCLRHVTVKPIIHICQNGTNLPFDIKDNRTIFYKNDMLGVQELKDQIKLFLQEIDYSKEYNDNPIYQAKRMGNLLKEVPDESENKMEIELLQSILNKLNVSLPYNMDAGKSEMDVVDVPNGYRVTIQKTKSKEQFEEIAMNMQKLLLGLNIKEYDRVSYMILYKNEGLIPKRIFRGILAGISRVYNNVSFGYDSEII